MELKPYTSNPVPERGHINAEEKIASLFAPDTLLSAQYFDNLRRKTILEPEKKLVLAVLEDAINCFQDNVLAESGKAKKLFDEAEEWVLDEGGDWIFSFRNVCEHLGFNPDYVRRGLLRWKEKKLASQPSRSVWEGTRMAG
ncbi:MAG TPA: hypothetical protein VGB27_04490 [Candidatus Binatia bacterium]